FLPVNIQIFGYNELRSATDNFHISNKIGRGGFGTVYKGNLKNRTQVAVKALSAQSKQGLHEFLTEIDTMSNVRNVNLVQIIGCCVEGNNRILVYEYLENNSLDRALLENITHISTRVAGTSGYLAPEYALQGKLTKKADVYSFGVLIIEIVSGRSNTETTREGMLKYLLEQTWKLYEEHKLLDLVDPDLEEYSEDEVIRYIKVALFCTQAAPARRPDMNQVVSMLSRDIRLNEKELTAPGFFQMGDVGGTSTSSKEKAPLTSQMVSNSNITITQVIPR
ncbi:Cysteine-rich receptor-like protein kinase, partial [Thalictrum thalictroides]